MDNEHKMAQDIARDKVYRALWALQALPKPALEAVLEAYKSADEQPIRLYLAEVAGLPAAASGEKR